MTAVDESSALVRYVTGRVATRLVEAIELDEADRQDGHATSETPLAADPRRQQLLVGSWLSDEIAVVNQDRMHRGDPPLSEMADREIRSRVVAELTGTGPLERFMTDPTVEEIDVNSHLSTWVTYSDGRKVDVGALWESSADLTAYQKRLARRMSGTGEGRLDTQSPMLTFQSDDGSRVVMVLGGRSEHGISTHPRIAIRRFVLRHEGLDGLADRGLFPVDLVPRLRAMIRCGFTVLVSGPPGAGKTTLLTELLGEVSPRERIITVEKNLLELRLEEDPRHPDAPALFTRHSNAEGEGEITTRQLVELTRRLNPDRVVVGELVEDEALDMLDVASMCKRGSLATIHAHTSDVVVQRLAYYVSKSDTSLPEFAVWSLIAQTVDFIVHIDLVRNEEYEGAATRRVTSIIEIGGLGERGGLASTEVWGIGEHGDLVQLAPLSARHLQRLRIAGYDPQLFAPSGAR
ncbi:MAG: ATPase, T2SS/T4P/T4SS family [Ilumatobacter sp.]|uniref:CpaF family protein n=1 Tax=Ilumatobacter sp. TaxID=1967498 RepID=UPI00263333A1|nr:ATPase, T2SS/T4P/T4SS family [Ilumatobacter sp.]MDJ0768003.1 ATPase, T2SS/T4P/T4SS family [Ilumatobacter sp.]